MRIISKYVLKEFISFLMFSILAFIAIFVLVDIVEHLDNLIDDNVGAKIILLYYIFFLPYIVVLTLPVAMLITTMFSLGRLVSDNEITALKASGVSLYRILFPLYIFSLFAGIFIMFFAEFVVPRTEALRKDIEDQGRNFRFSISRNREMDRGQVFLPNGDGSIIYAGSYDSRQKKASGVFIVKPYEYEAKNDSLKNISLGINQRIDADYMTYNNGLWTLYKVEKRLFNYNGEKFEKINSLKGDFITVKPADFAHLDIKPEEMNYFELRNYINSIKKKGGDISEWLVDLYMKISFPFVTFIIVFFGAPMVAGSTKRGKTASFGIALVISFVFYTIINAFQILGRGGTLNPVVAAWAPNCIFFAIGLFMHVRARK